MTFGQAENRRANFKDLLHFLERKTGAVLDPVFGEVHFPMAPQRAKPKMQQKDMRGSSFATTVTTIPELNKNKKMHACFVERTISWKYAHHSSTHGENGISESKWFMLWMSGKGAHQQGL